MFLSVKEVWDKHIAEILLKKIRIYGKILIG